MAVLILLKRFLERYSVTNYCFYYCPSPKSEYWSDTLRKFYSSQLCGGVNTLEQRDAIHGDLDRHKRWACVKLTKFNRAKCKVLHLRHGNPRHTYRLGREVTEGHPAEQDLGMMAKEKLSMSRQCALTAQKVSGVLGCIKRSVASGSREVIVPSILLSWDPTCVAVYSSGVPSLRTQNCSGTSPRGHKVDKRTKAPPLQRESEKVGAAQSGEGCV